MSHDILLTIGYAIIGVVFVAAVALVLVPAFAREMESGGLG